MRQFRIIISGGGTGGHIFPALAIARSLEKKIKNIDILFVGAKGKMEMNKIPLEGYKIEGLPILGLQRRFTLKNFLFPFRVIISLLRARKIINNYKPDIVIGTGGYASGPILYYAAIIGTPALVQEQNSFAGITNRILSKVVDRICVAYDNMDRFFPKRKIVFTGNPIRRDILNFSNKRELAINHFNLDANKKTVLVIGGSLGARTINQVIDNNINFFEKYNLNLIWQTGTGYNKRAMASVHNKLKGINAYKFIKDMDLAYAAADIIVSRAGAIAVSELCCIGKPTILIPSPNVSEDHQTKNAQAIVNKNAAMLVKDNEAEAKLVNCLKSIIKDSNLAKELSGNIKNLAVIDAADNIVNNVIELLEI